MSQRRSGGRENRRYGSRPRPNRYDPNRPDFRAVHGHPFGPLFSPGRTVAAVLSAPYTLREVRRAVSVPSEAAAG